LNKKKDSIYYLDKTANAFEVMIAVLLLIVIIAKLFDATMTVVGFDLKLLDIEFESILSLAFSLVIGVEFVRMLCKHTPETVIDVLLFAIARQTVLYYKEAFGMLLGVLAIGGLFMIRRFVIRPKDKTVCECADEE
jgi:hypothetical protein